ncbi:MAG: ATP-binding protein [Clostridiales Family XIII bacterium]|nr:ATP-binding protein [Clostridiales Family XIII bacterium]
MADKLKIKIPIKSEYVSTVRLTISSVAARVGFDVEALDDIKVAVSEACSNVILHGTDQDEFYSVEVEVLDDKLIISVLDNAGGFDLETYCEPVLDDPKQGGLGIFIMRALMDEVSVHSEPGEGTIIRMSKYLPVRNS